MADRPDPSRGEATLRDPGPRGMITLRAAPDAPSTRQKMTTNTARTTATNRMSASEDTYGQDSAQSEGARIPEARIPKTRIPDTGNDAGAPSRPSDLEPRAH